MDDRTPRDIRTVQHELAEVERHLRDTPPHHGSGVRTALDERRRALQGELARGRAAPVDEQEQA